MSRARRAIKALAVLAIGGIIMDSSNSPRQTSRTLNPVIPPRTMSERQIEAWAAQMGTTVDHAILMAMIASERPGLGEEHRAEQLAIISTAVNRARWPATFRLGKPGSDMWAVVVGAETTGAQGARREYASSRPPDSIEAVEHYHALVDRVLYGGVTTTATHFHHWPDRDRRDYIRGRRDAQGYGVVEVPGVARNADFFAPYPSKVASFERVEDRAAGLA